MKRLGAWLAVCALIGSGWASAAPPPAADTQDGQVYGQVDSAADLDRIFGRIREDVAAAGSRPELTRLYRRARYLVILTRSRPWRTKFGADAPSLQAEARRQFKATAQAINRRATEIGTQADYASGD